VKLEEFLMLLVAWGVTGITIHYFMKHRHQWRAKAVDHGVMTEPRRNATAILYVCAMCSEAKSMTVAGTYELDDICCSSTNLKRPSETRWSPFDKLLASSLRVKL